MDTAWKSLVGSFIVGLLIEYSLCVLFAWIVGDNDLIGQAFVYLAVVTLPRTFIQF
jgi:hypothetical protein